MHISESMFDRHSLNCGLDQIDGLNDSKATALV